MRPEPSSLPHRARAARATVAVVGSVMCLCVATVGCSGDDTTEPDDAATTQAAAEETTGAPGGTSSASGSTVIAPTSTTIEPESVDDGTDSSEEPAEPGVPGSTVVPSTSPPATATEQPPVGVETLPPVAIEEPAEVESGLVFTVVAVRDVEVEVSELGGDVAGPAVAVDIEVVNNGDGDVDLDRFVVTAEAGDAALSPIPGLFNEPFFGALAPGETASATYGFRTGGATVTELRLEDGLSRSAIVVEL